MWRWRDVSKAAKAAVEFDGERARRVVGEISPEASPATCLQSALRRRRFGCSPPLRSAFVATYAKLRRLLIGGQRKFFTDDCCLNRFRRAARQA